MKRLTKRPRPTLPEAKEKELTFNFRSAEKNFSMPSGDTMQSATFWSAMVAKGLIHPPTAILMVTCTSISRVYYCCHYFGDTIIGAIIGGVVGYTVEIYI